MAEARWRIKAGEFDDVYNLGGEIMHGMTIDADKKTATGYIGVWAKLCNFSLVRGWENENRERLHGHPIFNDKIKTKSVYIDDERSE